MSHRPFFVCGNWKLSGEKESIDAMIKFLNEAPFDNTTEIVIAPPAVHIDYIGSQLTKPNVTLAAQNCCLGGQGALTGEISPEMIKGCGGRWVILGHSERRHTFGETDQQVGEKVRFALDEGLNVILCVGETLQEKEMAQTQQALSRQMNSVLDQVTDWKRVVLAYEPVWALGTCKRTLPREVQTVHKALREWLATHLSEDVAKHTRIIFGGLVSGNHCRELAVKEDVDGFLVGGACLTEDFLRIVNARQ